MLRVCVGCYRYDISPTFNGTLNNTDMMYETTIINNSATEWIRQRVAAQHGAADAGTSTTGGTRPFFAYIAPHTPHGAAIPAPEYADRFPGVAPQRTPAFHVSCPDHHGLVAQVCVCVCVCSPVFSLSIETGCASSRIPAPSMHLCMLQRLHCTNAITLSPVTTVAKATDRACDGWVH